MIGVLAGLFGLAISLLVTGLNDRLPFPVVAVGDQLVDFVPTGLREWAIQTFGTSDKTVLLLGIWLALVLIAQRTGALAREGRWRPVHVWLGAIAAAGAVAGVAAPRVGIVGAIPALVGAAATLGALKWLTRQPVAVAEESLDASRRQFIKSSAAVAGATVATGGVAAMLRRRFSVGAERLALVLPKALRPLPKPATGLEATVDGVSPLITPMAQFYRIDTALLVPNVSKDSWRLRIHGMVDKPRTITYEQLISRELIEADITMSCVSNELGGGLVGNARWLGVRLDDLLGEVGISESADQIVGRSVDGWTGGFPTAVLDGRDAIIAVGMNGEPLPVKHGYPARLVVPGLYGYVSATKWLEEIELTRFDQFDAYWVPRGWSALGPIKTMSRIDTPGYRAKPGPVAIAGVAWAGERGIDRVEIRIDGGEWIDTTLGPELARTTWRQWHYAWDAPVGKHLIHVRATDGTGYTQTEERVGVMPDGATGWHVRQVEVEP